MKHGVRRVFTYGTAKTDSIFEIGSITKTFTGLALSQMAVSGKARLDEPVRELLPGGVVRKPAGSEITLVDLATHHSGLPAIPSNLKRTGLPNPGADYRASHLYDFLAKHVIARPAHASFVYSNAGYGLLGVALANRFGGTYAQLVQETVAGPLGLRDTAVSLSPEQQSRMIQAYDARHRPVAPWELDALAGAGAIRSTAGDMLEYLEAHLHPERLGPMATALVQARELKAEVGPGMRIGLAWIYNTDTGIYWHNGAISGYSSHAFFHPKGDYAAIILVNQAPGPIAFSELLAQHIRQRLEGEPAVSFANVAIPASGGVSGLLRMYAVYWAVMLASGAFIFCCVLGVQGLAAQLLPRRLYLRVSSWLQMAAFCLFVSVYFLQPMVPSPDALIAAQSQGLVAWSPSYWFLGLFQQLNGSDALAPLAWRAWAGLAIALAVTAAAYALSYFRTLRKIVEEPDIAPGLRGGGWLPGFGNSLSTVMAQFSIRTLMRSRQHRIILAFYLGIAFALTIFLLKNPAAQRQQFDAPVSDAWNQVSAPALAASLVIMGFWVVGTRVVFSMPVDLQANWIFRVTPVAGGPELLKARRRALVGLSVAPCWAGSAILFLGLWPWRPAAGHLMVLALLGLILAEICLHGVQKIPFTCSYLPGRSNFHMTFWLCIGLLMQGLTKAAEFEQRALDHPAAYAVMLGILGAGLVAARWRTARIAESTEGELQFEESPPWEVQVLGLNRDGA
ncbi:MAG: serine hydrolase domain-containing protein, partial [Bryobacteraceae bacterium]